MKNMTEITQSNKFQFPKIYNFPPFFTKQPNLQTRDTQIEYWRRIILDYTKFNKIWALSSRGNPLGDSDTNESDSESNGDTKPTIFENKTIKRALKSEFIDEIYTEMVKKNEACWLKPDNHRAGILIYWHSIEEWADMIMNWISNTGQEGSVLTLYELRMGELSQTQEFSGMKEETMFKVIDTLVNDGRARILKDKDGQIAGVKFGS